VQSSGELCEALVVLFDLTLLACSIILWLGFKPRLWKIETAALPVEMDKS
jgi:hypothetical protein